MSRCDYEPTLAHALADPVVRAVMAADGVNARELESRLNEVGNKLRHRRETIADGKRRQFRSAAE